MKNIFAVVFLLIFFCLNVFSQTDLKEYIFQNQNIKIFPDAMNNVKILKYDGRNSESQILDLDSFPVFPGFPKSVSGQSFEGGIYCQMDADTELEIVYAIGSTIQAWNLNGTNVSGWPVTLSFNSQGAPAFGDIDGDGQGEIVMGTSNFVGNAGAIYAFEINGTPVTGFPINHGATSRTIVLGNLDADIALEIIANRRISPIGEVWVYEGNGTVYPGWPKTLNHVPGSSSAVGDITGDGIAEIVSESFLSLYAFDRNGNILPGFPFSMPNGDVNSYSSPVLADVDGDNIREILFGTHVTAAGGFVYILKNNGTVLNGWPKPTSWWVYGPPVVGFINSDNIIDIIVGDQVGSGIPANYIYGWDKNGNTLAGFPIGPINAVNNQVAIADIDSDPQYELIVDDNTTLGGMGQYLAFNHDGTPVSGWPIPTLGTSFFNMPCIVDLNSNGTIDLVGAALQTGGGGMTNVYIWNTGLAYNPTRIINPVWQFNNRHNGVYGDNNIVGVITGSISSPTQFKLNQNYPNPFNPKTIITYQIANISFVTLKVYDVLGNELAVMVNQKQNEGSYSTVFDGNNHPSGIYFYTLQTDDFTETKSMLLIK